MQRPTPSPGLVTFDVPAITPPPPPVDLVPPSLRYAASEPIYHRPIDDSPPQPESVATPQEAEPEPEPVAADVACTPTQWSPEDTGE